MDNMRVNELLEFCDKFDIGLVFQGGNCSYYELIKPVDEVYNVKVEAIDAELGCLVIKYTGLDEKIVECDVW